MKSIRPFIRSLHHLEKRARVKTALKTNNLIPCLLFLLASFGPQVLQTTRDLFGGETSGLMSPAPLRRPYGMTPSMWRGQSLAYHEAGLLLKRPTQTIGGAEASAGTHFKDGSVRECIRDACNSYDYSAATDLSIRGYSTSQIHRLVERLAEHGFVAWYRRTGSFKFNRHIHMVFAGVRMKPILRAQVRDGLHDRTGLVGHARESFYNLTPAQKNVLRAQFLKANPL